MARRGWSPGRSTPPDTDPTSIAPPPTVCARPKTDSRLPVKPVADERVDQPRLGRAGEEREAEAEQDRGDRPAPRAARGSATSRGTAASRAAASPAPSRNEKRRPRVSATTPVGTSKITWPTREERVRGECLGVAQAGVEQEERVDAPDERRRERREQRQHQVGSLDRPRLVRHRGTLPGLPDRHLEAYRRGAGGVYRPRPRGMPGDPVRQPHLEGGSP